MASVDYALADGVGANTIGKRMRKRHNIDSLLVEPPLVIDIADDDIPQPLEGVKQGQLNCLVSQKEGRGVRL